MLNETAGMTSEQAAEYHREMADMHVRLGEHQNLLDQAAELLRQWQAGTGCGIGFDVQMDDDGRITRIVPTLY